MANRPLERKQVVIVLGMHRSGTSAITKSLELLGVNLGSDLHQPRADNPKGFWEDIEVVRINDKLLALGKGSWQSFTDDPFNQISAESHSDLLKAAVDLVRARTAELGVWGFKDPRSSRLIPFWKKVLEIVGFEPLFLIMNRNPLSVAASLAARDQLHPAKCAYLWAQHTLLALRDTVGCKRTIVDYDIFLSSPIEQIARIAEAFGLPMPLLTDPRVKSYINDFLSKDLRHTTYTLEELRSAPHISADAVALYKLALLAASDNLSADSADFSAKMNVLEQRFSLVTPALNLVNEYEQLMDAGKQVSESLRAQLSTLQGSYVTLESKVAEVLKAKELVAEELRLERGTTTDLRATISSKDAEIAQAQDQLRLLGEEISELTALLDAERTTSVSLESALTTNKQALNDLQSEHQTLQASHTQLTARTSALSAERDSLQARVHALQATIAEITTSKSWKVTAPLRDSVATAKRIRHSLQQLSRGSAMWVWHRTPISRELKDQIRDRAFSSAPFLFKSTNRYANWRRNRQSDIRAIETRLTTDETVVDGFVAHSVDPEFGVPSTRLIAFYLPQFHAIPENDAWWGEGFTEWTNVKPAKPYFKGHYQPHVPLDLGYYNLLDGQTQRKQVELAKQYGVGGFCFYMYWFAGKRLLEKPLDNYVADRSLDLPFCVCWANENWCRRWDGREQELLMSQQHSPEDDIEFISCAARYLADPRYIRVNGRPLLIIYRPSLFPNIQETAARWREWCRTNGIGEIHLAYTQSFESADPAKYGFDSAIEFPPNNASPPRLSDKVEPLTDNFASTVYDWRYYAKRSETYVEPPYSLFRSVCPSWDNTARRKEKGTVFLHSSPPDYQVWLENAIRHTQAQRPNPDERLIFINAWNEWAEGAHLEPDQRYGYAWLAATRLALKNTAQPPSRAIVLTTHDCHPHGAQIQTLESARTLKSMGFSVFLLTLKGGELLEQFSAVASVLNCSSASKDTIDAFMREARQAGATEAITSTIVSGSLLPKLKEHGFKVISLIHELPGIIREFEQHSNGELISALADKVVFPAEMVCSQFREIFPLDESKIVVRPQGLLRHNPYKKDKSRARQEVCTQYNIPSDAKLIVSVGYGDRRKGIDLFIEIAALVCKADPQAFFVWVGNIQGTLTEQIHERIKELGIQDRVALPGFCADPRVFFAAADLYALTSREDPFPNVVNEAIDVDLPVVAFEGATGAATHITDNNGLLARFEDTQDFADQITRTLATTRGESSHKVGSLRRYLLDLLHHVSGLPRVSVVIPNYNYERYLRERIQSVAQQTFPVYELIVLDDCSPDSSVEVIESCLAEIELDSLLVVNQTNSGSVFKQWRKGVELATGDLIWIAEADDLADPTFLATLTPRFQDPDLTLAYCESKMMDSNGAITAPNYLAYTTGASNCFEHDYHRPGVEEIADALSVKNTIPNVSAVLFRSDRLKSTLSRHQSEVEAMKVAGDWLLYLHLLSLGSISFCSQALNMHRRHTSSVTSSLAKVRHLEEIRMMQKLAAELVEPTPNKREMAEDYIEEIREYFGLRTHEDADAFLLQSNA